MPLELLETGAPPDGEDKEFLCPNCRAAFLGKIANEDGEIQRWVCPKCGYTL